jgi:hypothetical protein
MARGFIQFEVGDGKNIHLWLDSWHPFGALFDKFGYRIIYDFHSSLNARLDAVLPNGSWC